MKLVKETLFEKFLEDSDPIKDMGIGIYTVLIVIKNDKTYKYTNKDIQEMLNDFEMYMYTDNLPKWLSINDMYTRGLNNVDYKGTKQFLKNSLKNKKPQKINLNRSFKLPKINETFIQDSDPVSDMGIGMYNRSFEKEDKLIEFIITIIPRIFGTEDIPDNILTYQENRGILPSWLFYIIAYYLREFNTKWQNKKVNFTSTGPYIWPTMLRDELDEMGYKKIFDYDYVICKTPGFNEPTFFPHSIWNLYKDNLKDLGIEEIKN